MGWLRSTTLHVHQAIGTTPPTLVSAERPSSYYVPVMPGPMVVEYCIPEGIYSFQTAISLTVLCMIFLSCLVWWLASIPQTSDSDSQTIAAREVARPLLRGRLRRLDALEGLRTLLVMYVLIYHVRWALPVFLKPYFYWGHWAVQFFFVLSGFVAAYAHEFSADGPIDFSFEKTRVLVIRRLTRLCPAYFAALLGLAVIVALRGGGEPFLAWPVQALLLQSLMPMTVCGPIDTRHWSRNFLPFSANGEGWFVSAILVASLLFPLLHNMRPRNGCWATLRALMAVICLRSVPTLVATAGWSPIDLYTFAPIRVLEFASGMLSAQLYREMPTWITECGAWDWIFDASLLYAMIPLWLLGYWQSWATHESMHGDFFLTGIFCVTCMSARGLAEQSAESCSKALQASFLVRPCEEKERGCECQCGVRSIGGAPLSGILASRLFTAPAAYSYSAYIFQEIFIASFTLLPLYVRLWWLPITLPWIAAVFSLHFLEEPLKRCVEAWLRASRQQVVLK
mmetsp:Transcript_117474/g.184750  ORF Transcript_117474/g.184750 Transcript_117474/m.184750 type:complete len:510 (+) Transcript_117474:92-1621(+)